MFLMILRKRLTWLEPTHSMRISNNLFWFYECADEIKNGAFSFIFKPALFRMNRFALKFLLLEGFHLSVSFRWHQFWGVRNCWDKFDTRISDWVTCWDLPSRDINFFILQFFWVRVTWYSDYFVPLNSNFELLA